MEFNIASWNIRGMGTLDKQNEIKKLINDHKLSVCAILETQAKSKELDRVCTKIFNNWSWCTNMAKYRKGCRIVVGWNSTVVDVEVLFISWQVIFCLVQTVQRKTKFFCNFVYAANHGNERTVLWNEIEDQK